MNPTSEYSFFGLIARVCFIRKCFWGKDKFLDSAKATSRLQIRPQLTLQLLFKCVSALRTFIHCMRARIMRKFTISILRHARLTLATFTTYSTEREYLRLDSIGGNEAMLTRAFSVSTSEWCFIAAAINYLIQREGPQ